ncbi:MAG: hypothetical protein HRU09_03285 [Oligoflexales bacterium]|nr:hypothetical protein [Oligoflexales bacterium]
MLSIGNVNLEGESLESISPESLCLPIPPTRQEHLASPSKHQNRIDVRASNLHTNSEHDKTPASYRICSEMRDSESAWMSILLFPTENYAVNGAFLKVSRPVRGQKEVEILRAYTASELIDNLARAYAPKAKGEKTKANTRGCSGIEPIGFFRPLLYKTALVCDTPVSKLLAMASNRPTHLFGFKNAGKIEPG